MKGAGAKRISGKPLSKPPNHCPQGRCDPASDCIARRRASRANGSGIFGLSRIAVEAGAIKIWRTLVAGHDGRKFAYRRPDWSACQDRPPATSTRRFGSGAREGEKIVTVTLEFFRADSGDAAKFVVVGRHSVRDLGQGAVMKNDERRYAVLLGGG